MNNIYKNLINHKNSDFYPFHMPGHKRNTELIKKYGLWDEELTPYDIDITEIDNFDNLHNPEGIIKNAETFASEIYGSKESIYSVNGSYEGDDDIGRLMQDFKQTESEKMHNKILADNVRYVKGEKEDNEMSSLVEEYAEKVAKRYGESVAKEVEERVTKQVSLSTTIKTALAYGIDKKRIIDRLCSEFKLSEEEANKEYEKYVVTTA